MPSANGEERMANSGLSAFVLAGGRSSRMGTDKALLRIGERTLLERALRTASAVADSSYIVGQRQRYEDFGTVVEDIYAGCGPLGGIHAALTATVTDVNLILSVDMPLMSAGCVRWLAEQAEQSDAWIVVPQVAGGLQPLCAVYRRAVAAAAAEALRAGDYKVGRLFDLVPTRIVTEEEILGAGFSAELFRNVNTPEEYAQCRP